MWFAAAVYIIFAIMYYMHRLKKIHLIQIILTYNQRKKTMIDHPIWWSLFLFSQTHLNIVAAQLDTIQTILCFYYFCMYSAILVLPRSLFKCPWFTLCVSFIDNYGFLLLGPNAWCLDLQDYDKLQNRFLSRKPAKVIMSSMEVVAQSMGYKTHIRNYKVKFVAPHPIACYNITYLLYRYCKSSSPSS